MSELQFMEALENYKAHNKLMDELRKKPLTESDLSALIKINGGGADLIPVINELRSRQMIVPDKVPNYEEFKKQNPDKVCIKASILQQMQDEDFRYIYHRSPISVFQDIPAGHQVKHYRYKDPSGKFNKETGEGRQITIEDWSNRKMTDDDWKEIKKQERVYKAARKEIEMIKNSVKDLPLLPGYKHHQ